jgi:hypothetical protein
LKAISLLLKNAGKITIGNLLNHRSEYITSAPDYDSYSAQPKTRKEMIAIIAKGKSVLNPIAKETTAILIMCY